jgi:LysM repeat protein
VNQVFNISKSQVTINPPTQQELNLESTTASITVKVKPSEKEYLEKLAQERGIGVSTLIRKILFSYLKALPHLKSLESSMDEIII